jgi:6,7-dimethyl-8-ribityllumazine synthase
VNPSSRRLPVALIQLSEQQGYLMGQSNTVIKHQRTSSPIGQVHIAYIQAGWHRDIVGKAYHAFCTRCQEDGIDASQITCFDVAGSLEIPLQAKLLAESGKYAAIVCAGLIVDGGIYRHDFVASTVLDAMMQVQLESRIPVMSVVLTPHQFQETEAHATFFREHFKIKGAEAAEACLQTIDNIASLRTG